MSKKERRIAKREKIIAQGALNYIIKNGIILGMSYFFIWVFIPPFIDNKYTFNYIHEEKFKTRLIFIYIYSKKIIRSLIALNFKKKISNIQLKYYYRNQYIWLVFSWLNFFHKNHSFGLFLIFFLRVLFFLIGTNRLFQWIVPQIFYYFWF